MCIVFAFQLIRAKEVRIDIEVKRSEEKWREVMTCDVSPVAMFITLVVLIEFVTNLAFCVTTKNDKRCEWGNIKGSTMWLINH